MLAAYRERYERDLLESVIPFWLEHSLDRECGGYYTGLDRKGEVYDPRKYMWLQGREVWMFARLYNEWERDCTYLEAARLGADFIRRHGQDPQGRYFFSLTREGLPVHYQRKPYAAVFCMQGLLEYGRASGDETCIAEAKDLFWRIKDCIDHPGLIGRPPYAGQPKASSLANVMVMASMAIELARTDKDPRYREIMRQAVADIGRHYDPERRILLEMASLDGRNLRDWPEGRLFTPGHSIEVAWFLLHMLEFIPDAAQQRLALAALEGSLELGWDEAYGGLYYFMDIEGKPTLQPEADMKLWWPHTEAIYALILAYRLTREQRWLDWLEVIDRYSYEHFADPEYGEWYGYCDRRGNLVKTCKGGSYKGCFHVPRALLFALQRIKEIEEGVDGVHP